MSAIFTVAGSVVVYSNTGDVGITTIFAIGFFTVISAIGFVVLRVLAKISKKNEHNSEK